MFRVYAVLAMLCFGLAPLCYQAAALKLSDPYTSVVWHNIIAVSAVGGWIIATRRYNHVFELKLTELTWIALGAILTSCLAQTLYYKALETASVSQVAAIIAAYPLVTLLVQVMLLGQTLSLPHCAGLLMVVIGVILLQT